MASREYQREWREANVERRKTYQAEYRAANHERLAEQKREWYRANAERIREKARRRRREDGDALREINRRVVRRTPRSPEKEHARQIVADAIRRGDIHPSPCEVCGEQDRRSHDGKRLVQAHHDDYSKPLEVRWLCVDCHAFHHRRVA